MCVYIHTLIPRYLEYTLVLLVLEYPYSCTAGAAVRLVQLY